MWPLAAGNKATTFYYHQFNTTAEVCLWTCAESRDKTLCGVRYVKSTGAASPGRSQPWAQPGEPGSTSGSSTATPETGPKMNHNTAF